MGGDASQVINDKAIVERTSKEDRGTFANGNNDGKREGEILEVMGESLEEEHFSEDDQYCRDDQR